MMRDGRRHETCAIAQGHRHRLRWKPRRRITKGHCEPGAAIGHRLLFRYTAVDGVKQSTELLAPVDAWQTGAGPARGRVAVRVAPGDRRSIEIDIRVHSSLPSPVIAD